MTAAETLSAARQRYEGLGIATVYRTLGLLLEEGWLTIVELPGEPTRFERTISQHHHYFRCRLCEQVFTLPGCIGAISSWVPPGFVHERHEVVLHGECASCRQV